MGCVFHRASVEPDDFRIAARIKWDHLSNAGADRQNDEVVMRSLGNRTCMLAVAVFASIFGVASQAQAVPTFYVVNASTNSIDWTSAVNGFEETINSNVNFDTAAVGALPLGFYTASDGVTFSATGFTPTVFAGAGPNDGNTSGSIPGEGTHASSNHIRMGGPAGTDVLIISFDQAVLGVGLFTIDYFGSQTVSMTFAAFDGINGTGTMLGSGTSIVANLQPTNLYFMGVTDPDNVIRSVVFSHINPAGQGDTIGVDDILFAGGAGGTPTPATPAPATPTPATPTPATPTPATPTPATATPTTTTGTPIPTTTPLPPPPPPGAQPHGLVWVYHSEADDGSPGCASNEGPCGISGGTGNAINLWIDGGTTQSGAEETDCRFGDDGGSGDILCGADILIQMENGSLTGIEPTIETLVCNPSCANCDGICDLPGGTTSIRMNFRRGGAFAPPEGTPLPSVPRRVARLIIDSSSNSTQMPTRVFANGVAAAGAKLQLRPIANVVSVCAGDGDPFSCCTDAATSDNGRWPCGAQLIAPAPVPEPGQIWQLLSGLAGLGCLYRLRRRA